MNRPHLRDDSNRVGIEAAFNANIALGRVPRDISEAATSSSLLKFLNLKVNASGPTGSSHRIN